jgi:tRNA(Ile)-lysidine synthase
MKPTRQGRLALVVACSGGADSTALLALLALIAEADRLELTVAHVDHGIRVDSGRDAEHVAALAAGFGVPFVQQRLELAAGSGLPARARDARRAALLAMAGERAVALAHTQTDQAETSILHATRGAGLDGLAAMPTWDRPWLRPLLGVPRAETRALCGRLGVSFVDDPGQPRSSTHPRVRVREELLPVLREQNPRAEAALAALAEQAADAEMALSQWAGQEELARRRGRGTVGDRRARQPTAGGPYTGASPTVRRLRSRHGGTRARRDRLDRRRVLCGRAEAANALDAGSASLARAPRSWDLRPGLRLRLDREGLCCGPAR